MATYNGHNEDATGNILLSIGNGMTATLETGTKASQAYAKGAYLYYNNRLCKTMAAIVSGNTFVIGTNLAYTSIGAELTSHLRASNGDEFYFDYKDGKPGYYPTASKTSSQFVPISTELTKVLSGVTSGTYSLTSVPGYQNLTVEDFILVIAKWSYSVDLHGGSEGTGGKSNIVPSITYTASSGQLVLANCKGSATSTNSTDIGHNVGAGSVTLYLDIYIQK